VCVCYRVAGLLDMLLKRATQPIVPASILVVSTTTDNNPKAAESISTSTQIMLDVVSDK